MSIRAELIWADLADHARLPFEEARMLPPATYTSPDVCAHRGSPLLHGCGNESRITCPYHAWVYRLDGQLIGAPYMNRTVDRNGRPFDPADHRLTPLRLEQWEGFLFVTQDPDAADLGSRLAGLSEVVGRYRMAAYVPVHRQVDVWDTNWKLLYENFMDAYHVFKVHKNSFAKNGDNTLLTTMHAGTDHFAYHLVGHDAGAKSGVAGVFRGVQGLNLARGPLSYLERNVYDFDRYIARTLTGAVDDAS